LKHEFPANNFYMDTQSQSKFQLPIDLPVAGECLGSEVEARFESRRLESKCGIPSHNTCTNRSWMGVPPFTRKKPCYGQLWTPSRGYHDYHYGRICGRISMPCAQPCASLAAVLGEMEVVATVEAHSALVRSQGGHSATAL